MKKEARRKRRRAIALRVLTCLCVAAMLAGMLVMLGQVLQYWKGAATYKELAGQAVTSKLRPEEKQAWPEVDFGALKAINPDVKAWIYAEGTPLNYPVVQGSDNEACLDHLFDGTPGMAGCLFIDAENQPFEDHNTVLYGHNLLDGSMFSCLTKYQKQAYYDEHPCLYLLTPEAVFRVDLLSGYTTTVGQDSWRLHFDTTVDFIQWQENTMARSGFASKASVSGADRVVTLSTCIGGPGSRRRYVLVGKLAPVG